jgi:hypothetical protein
MKKGIKRVTAFKGKSNHTTLPEFEKSKIRILLKVIEDFPSAMVSKAPVKKANGNIVSMSFDNDELPTETSSFRYLYSDNKWRG